VNRRTYLFLGVAALLLLPAVAMLFTDKARWRWTSGRDSR